MLTTILYGLLYLAGIILVVYIIFWILGLLGVAIPENIKKVIWAIVLILAIIWIVSAFFQGGDAPIRLRR